MVSRHGVGKSIVMVCLTAMVLAPCVTAVERMVQLPDTITVTGMKGNPDDHNRVSGLALTVEDAGWPTLSMLSGHPGGIIAAYEAREREDRLLLTGLLIPACFGCASLSTGGRLIDQEVSEVTNTLTFGSESERLEVTVTRLSPAVLLESDSKEIELFGLEEAAVHNETFPPRPAP